MFSDEKYSLALGYPSCTRSIQSRIDLGMEVSGRLGAALTLTGFVWGCGTAVNTAVVACACSGLSGRAGPALSIENYYRENYQTNN